MSRYGIEPPTGGYSSSYGFGAGGSPGGGGGGGGGDAGLASRVTALESELRREQQKNADMEDRLLNELNDQKRMLTDQQEAMDALMDLLEKTGTVEDTQDMIAELEGRCFEKIDEAAAGMQDVGDELARLDSKLEVSVEHAVKRIDDATADFNAELLRVEEALKDNVRSSETANDVLSERLRSDMVQIDTKCQAEVAALAEDMRRMETGLGDRIEQRASSKAVDEWLNALDRRLNESQAHLEQSLDRIRSDSARAEAALLSNVESNLGGLEAKLNGAVKTMGSREAALIGTVTDNLRSIEQDAQTRRAELKQAVDAEINQLREQADTSLYQLNVRLDDEGKAFRERLAQEMGTVEAALTQLDTKLVTTSKRQSEELNERIKAVEAQTNTLGRQTDSSFTEAHKRTDALTSELQQCMDQVKRDRETAQASARQASSELSLATGKIENEVQRNYEHFTSVCGSIDSKFTTAMAADAAKADDHRTSQQNRISDIERNNEKMRTEHGGKLAEATRNLQEQNARFSAQHASLTQQITQRNAEVDTRISDIQGDFQTTVSTFERKSNEKDAAQDVRMEAINTELLRTVAALETKEETKQKALEGEVVALARHFKATTEQLEQKVSSELAAAAREAAKRGQEQERTISQLAQSVAANEQRVLAVEEACVQARDQITLHYEHFTDTCNQLDIKYTEKCLALDSQHAEVQKRLAEVQRDVGSAIDSLRTQLVERGVERDARMDEIDSRLTEDRDHFSDVCAALEQAAQRDHEHFSNVGEALDEKFSERTTALEQRQQNAHSHFTQLCENIGAKVEEAEAAQDARSETLRSNFVAMHNDFADKTTVKQESVDRRMDDMLELMHKNRQHFTAACDSMDKTLKSKDKIHDERLVDVRKLCERTAEVFTDYRSDLEGRIAATSEEHEKTIATNHKEVVSRIEAQEAAFTKRVDGLESEHGKLIDSNDKWIKHELAELQREVESNKTATEHRMKRAESEAAQNVELLRHGLEQADQRFSAKAEQQDSRMHEMGMALDKTNVHFTDACSALDAKFLYNNKQDDVIQQHHEHMLSALQVLESKLSAKNVEQDARTEAIAQHFTDMASNMEQRLEARNEGQDERISQLNAALVGEHERVEELCAKLEQRMKENYTKLEQQLDAMGAALRKMIRSVDDKATEFANSLRTELDHHKTNTHERCDELRDAITALGDRVDSNHIVVNDRVEREHAHFTRALESLDTRHTQLNTEQTNARQELAATVQQHHLYFTNVCHNIDAKFTQANALQDDRIKAQHHHFIEACSDLDEKLEQKNTSQDARMVEIEHQAADNYSHVTTALADADRRLTAKDKEQDEKTEHHYVHFTEQCAALETSMLEKDREQDVRMEELNSLVASNHRMLTEEMDSLDKKFTQMVGLVEEQLQQQYQHFERRITDLGNVLDDNCMRLQDRLDQLTSTVMEHHQYFADKMFKLDEKVVSSLQEMNTKIVEMQSHFNDLCVKIERKFGERMENHHMHLTDIARSVDQKLTESIVLTEERIGSLTDKVAEHHGETTSVLASMEKHFTNVSADIVQRFQEEIELRDEKIDDQGKHLKATLVELDLKVDQQHGAQAKRIHEQHMHFTDVCSALERNHVSKTSALSDAIAEMQQHFTMVCSDMDAKLVKKDVAQDERMDVLDRRIHEDRTHITQVCSGLETAMEERHQHLTRVCEAIDEKFSELGAAADAKLANEHQHFTDVCANIDAKFSEKNVAQDTRLENQRLQLVSLNDDLDRKFTDRLDSADNRVADVVGVADRDRAHFTELCDSLDVEFRGKNAAQDERMDEHRDMITKNHAHFTDVCKMVDKKFSEGNRAQDEHTEELSRHFTDLSETMDRKVAQLHDAAMQQSNDHFTHLSELVAAMEERALAKNESQDMRAEECEASLAQLREHFTEVCAELDEKFTVENASQDERNRAELEAARAVSAELDEKFTAQGEMASAQAEESAARQEDAVAGLMAQCEGLDEKYAAESSSIRSTLIKFAEKNATQDTRMDGFSIKLQEECSGAQAQRTEMERRVAAQDQMHSERLAEQRAHYMQLLADLEARDTERAQALDSRADKLGSNIMLHYEHFNTLCGSIDRKFESDNADRDDRMQVHHQHFTDLVSSLDVKYSRKVMEHEVAQSTLEQAVQDNADEAATAARKADAKILELHEAQQRALAHEAEQAEAKRSALERKVDDGQAAHSERVDRLVNTVQDHHQEFTHKTDTTASTLKLEVSKLENRAAQLQDDLRASHDNVVQRMGDGQKALESRVSEARRAQEDGDATLRTALRQLDDKCAAKDLAQDEVVAAHHERLSHRCDDIGEEHARRAAAQDSAIEELGSVVQEHHQHFSNVCSNIDSKFGLKNEAQDEVVADLRQHFTDVCANLEDALRQKIAAQGARADALSDTVQRNYTQLSSSCAGIEAELQQRCDQLGARVAEESERADAALGALAQTVSSKNAAQDQRQDELGQQVEANWQHFTQLCARIEEQGDKSNATLDERVVICERHFADLYATLDSKFTDKNLEQDERADVLSSTLHEHGAQTAKGMDDLANRDVAHWQGLLEEISLK